MGGADLISEKQFAASHVSFWNGLLPMAEEYLRAQNRSLSYFASALHSAVPPDRRGLINELSFRMYISAQRSRVPVESLPEPSIARCVFDTLEYLKIVPEETPPDSGPLANEEMSEATHLAARLALFFRRFAGSQIRGFPVFRGCGWIDKCEGDILGSKILFEVKAGERNFRSVDLRQVFVYCALNFASKAYDIKHICLVNPRVGVFLAQPLQRLCLELSGRTAPDVLGDIVAYVSQPAEQYPSA